MVVGRRRLCRAEALAYMPILRTNHVVQGFIPANSWSKVKNSKSDNFYSGLDHKGTKNTKERLFCLGS